MDGPSHDIDVFSGNNSSSGGGLSTWFGVIIDNYRSYAANTSFMQETDAHITALDKQVTGEVCNICSADATNCLWK